MALAVCRVQSESEFRELYDLFVEYEADLPAVLRHGVVPEIAKLRTAYADRNAAFVARAAERAVGCVAVARLDAERALLLRLFVKTGSRGAGAARALVTAALDFARAQGHRRILLDTNKERLMPAYRLYRSLGFRECAPFAGVTYECPTFMELLLDGPLGEPN